MIGLLYKAYPDSCQHRFAPSAETKTLPHRGALALGDEPYHSLSPKMDETKPAMNTGHEVSRGHCKQCRLGIC